MNNLEDVQKHDKAIRTKNWNEVIALIEDKLISPNYKCAYALRKAIEAKEEKVYNFILNKVDEFEEMEYEFGKNPIVTAVTQNNKILLEKLINLKVFLPKTEHVTGDELGSYMHMFINHHVLIGVKCLFDNYKIDVDKSDSLLLKIALNSKCNEIINYILEKNPNKHFKVENSNEGAVIYAIDNQNIELLNKLNKEGHDLHDAKELGFRRACKANATKSILYYLEYHGEQLNMDYIHSQNADYSAIKLAIANDCRESVEILINSPLFKIDNEEMFIYAANKNQLPLLKLFYKKGVDINAGNGAAILNAVNRKNIPLIKFLLHNKVDIHVRENKAISDAFGMNDLQMINLFIPLLNADDISMLLKKEKMSEELTKILNYHLLQQTLSVSNNVKKRIKI